MYKGIIEGPAVVTVCSFFSLTYPGCINESILRSLSRLSLGRKHGISQTCRQSITELHTEWCKCGTCIVTLTSTVNLESPVNLICSFRPDVYFRHRIHWKATRTTRKNGSCAAFEYIQIGGKNVLSVWPNHCSVAELHNLLSSSIYVFAVVGLQLPSTCSPNSNKTVSAVQLLCDQTGNCRLCWRSEKVKMGPRSHFQS